MNRIHLNIFNPLLANVFCDVINWNDILKFANMEFQFYRVEIDVTGEVILNSPLTNRNSFTKHTLAKGLKSFVEFKAKRDQDVLKNGIVINSVLSKYKDFGTSRYDVGHYTLENRTFCIFINNFNIPFNTVKIAYEFLMDEDPNKLIEKFGRQAIDEAVGIPFNPFQIELEKTRRTEIDKVINKFSLKVDKLGKRLHNERDFTDMKYNVATHEAEMNCRKEIAAIHKKFDDFLMKNGA